MSVYVLYLRMLNLAKIPWDAQCTPLQYDAFLLTLGRVPIVLPMITRGYSPLGTRP